MAEHGLWARGLPVVAACGLEVVMCGLGCSSSPIKGSSVPGIRQCPLHCRGILNHWTTWEAQVVVLLTDVV